MAEDWPKIKSRHTTRVSPWMAIIEREVDCRRQAGGHCLAAIISSRSSRDSTLRPIDQRSEERATMKRTLKTNPQDRLEPCRCYDRSRAARRRRAPEGHAWAKNPQALAGRLRRAQTVVVPVVRLIGPR